MADPTPALRRVSRLRVTGLPLLIAAAGSAWPAASRAQAVDQSADLSSIRAELARQAEKIAEQEEQLAQQRAQIARLEQGQATAPDPLLLVRARGLAGTSQTAGSAGEEAPPPDQPVGEAPPDAGEAEASPVAAVPQEQGVLTRRGQLVFEPSFQYVNSANDRLVFRGFELIPGIQIGVIEASRARRDTLIDTLSFRYGITSRFEVEARVSALYRNDSIRIAQQRDENIVRRIDLSEGDVGDAEVSARYQLNAQNGQNPIWIAGLRVKSDTGKGPFDIGYDDFGVATGLTTGSGFWGVQPSISVLIPSDPVVIFGGANYLYHIPRDINRTIAGVPIGRVDPGDSISASIGFGFALNPRFSYSLGYRHSYIVPTKTEIGGSMERSDSLQVGSFTFGMSYRLTQKVSANLSVEIGVTEDAPDLGLTLRFPISF